MWTRSPDLVGRAVQLDRIRIGLDDCRSGRGGAIFLVGEAGIGKTRLAATATSEALAAGSVTMRGRGSSLGPLVPFRPLTEALLGLSRSELVPDVSALGPYQAVLGTVVPEWADPGETSPAPTPVVFAEAFLRLLRLTEQGAGLLLVLEDLHSADAETLAVVDYLLDNLDDQPVLVLGTARPEGATTLELLQAAERRGAADLVTVGPLGHDDVGAQVAACLEAPLDDVPAELVDRLHHDSVGNPFYVEELLRDYASEGQLIETGDGWRLVGDRPRSVPDAVVRSVARRTSELGPESREVLGLAAVLGQRFALSVVREAMSTDESSLLGVLQGGVVADLVEPDEPAPDWYAFRHPLTAEALVEGLVPLERADLSGQAARAVQRLHPELDGDWCALVASLYEQAGDAALAGELYATAGSRASAAGATASAVALLQRAVALLDAVTATDRHAAALVDLLHALAESGRYDDARQLSTDLDELVDAGLPAARRAAVHAGLAHAAHMAGEWAEAEAQVAAATALLGPEPADVDAAPVDAIAAHLALNQPGPDRLRSAAALAERAAAAADRAGLPTVACDAWQLLGVLARDQDLAAASRWFARAREHAERHGLPIERVYSEVLDAGTACLATGDVVALEAARDHALRIGAIPLANEVDSILAMQCVLRAEFDEAADRLAECLRVAHRLRLGRSLPYLRVAEATLAAHRADRAAMDAALAALGSAGTGFQLPMSHGMARAFCALLEEDPALARQELAQAAAYDAENPTTMHLAGQHGLAILLAVLDGRAQQPHVDRELGTAAGTMRWNAQFLALAQAVLHGAAGRPAEAADTVQRAVALTEFFPTARHLGLRLIAAPAHRDGWGDPEGWLRAAEEHFHAGGVDLVAAACRTLLRRLGASVRQRREGAEQVPPELRHLGVTVREWQVGQLLTERIANRALAERLHISPRTVEKHVASLLLKTAQPDRDALIGMITAAGG